MGVGREGEIRRSAQKFVKVSGVRGNKGSVREGREPRWRGGGGEGGGGGGGAEQRAMAGSGDLVAFGFRFAGWDAALPGVVECVGERPKCVAGLGKK